MTAGMPTLERDKLIDEVRRLLHIPKPNGAAPIIQAEADATEDPLVKARLNRMAAQTRGDHDHTNIPLRDVLDLDHPFPEKALAALTRYGIVTVKDALARAEGLGCSLAAALGQIPGVGKAAARIAKDVEASFPPVAEPQ